MNRARTTSIASALRQRCAVAGFCVLVLPCTSSLHAQAVRGVVTSRGEGNAPVVFAEVTAVASGLRSRTNSYGEFRLLAAPGDSIRIRALGFRERRLLAGTSSLTILLEPLPTMLDKVVTTVGQREITTGQSPASITVLSKNDIAAAGAVSANQLLRRIPGLQEIGSPPAQTSIAIRGLDQSRVLVLIDGEPVAGAMTENRDIGRLSTMAAERIEVVKGPSSVEYGSEALGGVVNLVTAAPATAFIAEATVRTGELGRRESALEISDTYGRVGVRLNGGWRQSDRVTAISASSTTLDRVYDFRGDTRIRLSDRIQLRSDPTMSQQRQRWPVGAGFNGFIDNRTVQGFVEAQMKLAGGMLRARTFGQRYAYQFREALGLLPITGSADSLEQRERMARGLIAYSRMAGQHSLDAGVQFSARGIVSPTKITGDSVNDRVVEVFARDAWTIGSVLLTAGARTSSSSLWGNAISPSVGAVWQVQPMVRVRANVARGFRAPSFKELRYTFINGAAGYQIVGNPDLRPESSWSTTVGGTWVPAAGLSLELEGYRNTLANLIATRDIGLNNAGLIIFRNINVERARTEGIEASVRHASARTELSLGYDYLRARDLLTGRTLDGRATHTARAAVSQRWTQLGGTAADLSTRFTGAAPRGMIVQGSFLSVDGQVRVGLRRAMELSLGVTNLLDQQPTGWTAAFQRQVYVGLRGGYHAAR
ncbi:MAG: TonB-dependent receptor [Gemmatimonadaceae bacterium]|nr:TonB-dependent receptor [Gemmatimonadaceae bacterium]